MRWRQHYISFDACYCGSECKYIKWELDNRIDWRTLCEYSGGNIYSALVGLLLKIVASLYRYEQDTVLYNNV